MSIYAYTGLPGSGKSYSVVEHQVIPAIKAGRRVVTNVALKLDAIREEFPAASVIELPTQKVQTDPASIYDYVSPGSVLILDEVWRLFPAGLKANHVPEPFRKLLAEHRHMVDAEGNSVQVVLVTQDLAQISAFARQLVEQTFRTVKLSSVGLSTQFRVDVFNGPASGPNPPESQRIRQLYGQFSAAVYRFYESHTLRVDGGAGKVNEKAVDRRANVLRRPAIWMGGIAAVALITFGVMRLSGTLESMTAAAAPTPAVAGQGAPPQRLPKLQPVRSEPQGVEVPQGGAQEKTVSAWRIAAIIQNLDVPERSWVMLTDGTRNVSRPLSLCAERSGWWECPSPDTSVATM